MSGLPENLNILIIEDNKGDQLLVTDYLKEELVPGDLTIVESCESAIAELSRQDAHYQLILLDVSLPDRQGEDLIQEILQYSDEIPIIVLTGYSNVEFSVKSLVMGVADYLLKDTLTPASLYKSITQTFERVHINQQLALSNKRYQELFQLNPQPVLIVSVEDFRILDINKAALRKYKCSRKEFLELKMPDIQDDFNEDMVQFFLKHNNFDLKPYHVHRCMDNNRIVVDLKGSLLDYKGINAIQILAVDITERFKYIQKIEKQNKMLNDIAWQQSHMVRAPLSRLMGLVDVFEIQLRKTPIIFPEQLQFLLKNILSSAHEIDNVVQDIVKKTYKEED